MKGILRFFIFAGIFLLPTWLININASEIEIVKEEEGFIIEQIWNTANHTYDMYLSRENNLKLINNGTNEGKVRLEFISSENYPAAAFLTIDGITKTGVFEFLMPANSEIELVVDIVCMPKTRIDTGVEFGTLSLTIIGGEDNSFIPTAKSQTESDEHTIPLEQLDFDEIKPIIQTETETADETPIHEEIVTEVSSDMETANEIKTDTGAANESENDTEIPNEEESFDVYKENDPENPIDYMNVEENGKGYDPPDLETIIQPAADLPPESGGEETT